MKEPFWVAEFELLTAVNPDYCIVIELLDGLYKRNLEQIIHNYLPDKNCYNLSYRETQVFFLKEIMFKFISLDKLKEYYDYFQKNFYGEFGVNEHVCTLDLRQGDKIKYCGQMVIVTEVVQENVYANFKGEKTLVFDSKMWTYKYY